MGQSLGRIWVAESVTFRAVANITSKTCELRCGHCNLLKRIVDGDRDAFAEVVETFQRPLFGFSDEWATEGVAVEIAQETFLRAWRNLGQYQTGRAEFSTWLFSIARNLALTN